MMTSHGSRDYLGAMWISYRELQCLYVYTTEGR